MKNKVALITGASRGIGRATAIEFAKRGANVIINYNQNRNAAEELRAWIIADYGVRAITVQADVANEAAIKNMVDIALAEFGRIDFLVNNAGIVFDKDWEDKTADDWRKTFDTNVIGTWNTSKLVAPVMLKNKFGRIVNISSTSGSKVFLMSDVDYSASKAAVIALTKSMSVAYAPYINVNSIAPSWVDTEMNADLPSEVIAAETERISLKRFARPEEIAKPIVFLCSEDADYINGAILEVDGGY